MPETQTEEIRSLTPPEYVKYANARDRRERHSLDLHHFIEFYIEQQGHQGANPRTVDAIIEDYLDAVEPQS